MFWHLVDPSYYPNAKQLWPGDKSTKMAWWGLKSGLKKGDRVTVNQIHQGGNLGVCWIYDSLTFVEATGKFTAPGDSEIDCYGVTFYLAGKWTEIKVDDR